MAVLLFEITHKSNKIYIMMKSISKLLMMVPVLMAAMLCSCNDDNDTPIPSGAFTVFATLERLDNTGATFTTQELDDSELVTYVTTQELDSKIYTVGKRYVIVFSNQSGKRFQSGEITLYMAYSVFNGKAESHSAADCEAAFKDPVNLSMIYRTGKWLNVEATAPVGVQPKVFTVYVDQATINNDVPEVYVAFKTDNINGPERTFFGSFDLSPVWNLSTCRGLRVHYFTKGVETVEVITKTGLPIKPEL